MFLNNHWYVAAWSRDVGSQPFARTILNEPVVLFRQADGKIAALEDRCIHRLLPLSMGKIVDSRLQCHYHGLEFDASGKCVKIPGQEHTPADAWVKSYRVFEKYGWVWIFMGDPELADPNRITDFHWLDDPSWGAKGTTFHVPCNWQLIVDNLLDLTHLTYVHGSTIGNDANAGAEVKFETVQEGVRVTRWILDAPAPPTYVKAGKFTTNVDRWQIINWTPPGFVRIDVGATPAGTGAPAGRRTGGINMWNLNAMTPETESTTHYFWAQAHDFSPRDAAVTEMLFHDINTAFLEDAAVFTEQQRMIDRDPNRRTINIRVDGGGIQARRMIDALFEKQTLVEA